MRRRKFITYAGSAAAMTCWPLAALGQISGRRAVIAYLGSATPEAGAKYIGVLRSGLADLGLVEGRDFDFVPRFAAFKLERLPELAQELVQLKPVLIVASAVDTAIVAKKATSSIPIVSAALADAEHLGLVANYARPGGNVTGITPYIAGLPAKQMELARELVVGATKVALVGNMGDAKASPQRAELEEAATKVGAAVIVADVRSPEDLPQAIRELANKRPHVAIMPLPLVPAHFHVR